MSKAPKVSAIIVNYNGKQFLHDCITSLVKLKFPKTQYELIVVDNNSRDTSVEYIKRNFPFVKLVESDINLGFAGGCNLGVEHAQGKYIVFLNTDTKVDENWLSYLVKRIELNKQIAAVNSKALLYFPFIEITFKSDIYMRSEFTNSVNFQPVGILLENILLDNQSFQPLVRYCQGFYDKEKGLISARWTKGDAKVLLPCDPRQEVLGLNLTIRSEKSSSNLKTHIVVKLGEEIVIEDDLKSYEVKQYRITLRTEDIEKYFLYAVQNSGVVVFKNGYGRDRGAVVKADRTQFYEIDNSFYNQAGEITSFCGASVLLRKELFKKMTGFDKTFFMYYEDVDLSLRLKRSGYKIYYEPKSVVYHIHAASSGEWSPLFTYNVEKNHLAVLVKHFPLMIFWQELVKYFILWGVSILKMVKWRLKEHWELYDEWKEKVECRTGVLRWIFENFIQLLRKRLMINRVSLFTMKDIYQKLN